LCNGGFIKFLESGRISAALSCEFDGLILESRMDFFSAIEGDSIEISLEVILVVAVPPP
jgi:hypothetical protein